MNDFVKKVEEKADEFGSIPFWSWNDKLEPEELRRQIRRMHYLKMKGFFMHARGGLETPYLGEEWFECIKASADEAQKLGMEAWLYDENGWPSGFAGGALFKDPANFALYLEMSTKDMPDPEAMAVYIREGSKVRLRKEGEIFPEYYCIYKRACNAYVDTMDARVTDQFIEATHQEYKKRFGDLMGTVIPGFFTDEPQYYRWATPWSDTFPEAFQKAFGYDVMSGLAALFTDYDGAEQFRYDYHKLCHTQFLENFARPVYEWAEANGCKITGHTIEESFLAGQMWCTGGVMPFYRYEHIPGIDHLCRGLGNDLSPKQIGSVAAQLGKKRVLTESFAACGWDVSPLELKNILQWQYASGINLTCQHLYPYSIRGQRKGDYPAFYSEHSPWQDALKDFNQYFNRLGAALAEGKERANVLVIHPIHSCWMKYKRIDDGSIWQFEENIGTLVREFADHQVLYHFGDEVIMKDYGSVKNGKLVIGECRYETVVLPYLTTLDSSTADLLKEFLAQGGKIAAPYGFPQCIDGRPADLSWLKAELSLEDIWNISGISVKSFEGGKMENIRLRVMDREDGSTYYLVNLTMDERKAVNVDFGTELPVKQYDPETGKTVAEYETGHFTVDFKAGEGFVFYTERTSAPENAITLDKAQVAYGDGVFGPVRQIAQIKDLTLRKRFEGDVQLKFAFKVKEIPECKVSMACEPMNYNYIKINGENIELEDKWWLDRSFKTCDITDLIKTGENQIEMSFSYYQDPEVYDVVYDSAMESRRNCLSFNTEIESIYVFGEFGVETDSDKFTSGGNGSLIYSGSFDIVKAPKNLGAKELANVVTCGYPFFAGEISGETSFELSDKDCVAGNVKLSLEGRFAYADVYVNNRLAGRFMFNKELDISGLVNPGKNKVRVIMCNTGRNLLGPHHQSCGEAHVVSPSSFSSETSWTEDGCPGIIEEYAFMPFGVTVKITAGSKEIKA